MASKRSGGEGSGEQANSQKSMVEMLKQELRVRDSLHNSDKDIWLPKLTPIQSKATIDLAVKVANAASSSDVFEFGSNVYNNYYARESAGGGSFVFDVHSVSQVNLIVGTLQALLYEACNGDFAAIARVIERTLIKNKLISSPSPQPPQRSGEALGRLSPPVLESTPERQAADAHDEIDSDTMATGRSNFSTYSAASNRNNTYSMSRKPPSRSGDAADILRNHSMNGILTEEMNELFQTFVGCEDGAFLYDNYVEAKSTCQSSQLRLKELVDMVNKQSSEIENLKQQQQQCQGSSSNMEIFNELQSLITMAKMDYRAYHSELVLCKEQISDTQALRKRALQLFLAVFEKFCSNNAGENKVIDIEEG